SGNAFGGSGSLVFPGGWGVGGALEFAQDAHGNLELDDIALALQLGDAEIPIGPTGLFLASMDAGIDNLDNVSQLTVAGSLTLDFGGQISVSIGGETRDVTILRGTGSFVCDAEHLTLSAGVYVGAYTQGAMTTGLIGQGTGKLDLDWATGVYSLDLS